MSKYILPHSVVSYSIIDNLLLVVTGSTVRQKAVQIVYVLV